LQLEKIILVSKLKQRPYKKYMFNFLRNLLSKLFGSRKELKLGFYGPPNAGKTTLANRIAKDFAGVEMGIVSNIAHETRKVTEKQHIIIQHKGKKMTFAIVDTPGIATKIDYDDFIKSGLKKNEAKKRAEEATRGVIEAIEWLDKINIVVVVLDATQSPMTQVNITLIGNIIARKIPVVIAANKTDLKGSNIKEIEVAFPQYSIVPISAKEGKNLDKLYQKIFEVSK